MTTSKTTPAHSTDHIDALRERMIERLWAVNALRSQPVAEAVRAVPRHLFAPDFPLEEVYDAKAVLRTKFDDDGQATSSVSATWIQTLMLERAEIQPGMRVLEIGSGGYNAALIAEVVGPEGRVTSVDIDPGVTGRARTHLAQTTYADRVEVVLGDAEHGYPAGAPYDRIIVTVAATDLPSAWTEQLVEGGRLVLPLGVRGFQRVYAFTHHGQGLLVGETGDHAGFVPMQGLGAPAPTTVPLTDQVALTTDADPVPAPDRLPEVFAEPAHEQCTGVRIGRAEYFGGLQLWLATTLPGFATLSGDAQALGHATMGVHQSPAIWDGTDLAYLVLPQAATDPDRWEFLARGHGPNATELIRRLVEHVRRWDREHRHGPGPRFIANPALPDAPEMIPMRHTRLLALWDQPQSPQLDWDADPDA
ncbi:methyltransferase, FxLD system [Nocardiopsis metallicus]|uniref:Protein-L-isoaspartate O-methyltransferase n=1 Tax=Nocardiopsis metallicus TaxID=179819 RepID=A0A840WPC6_9ACTN|nr:methyltransferase, FxLD system [Nocardiopsis metallicus]MBB5494861.1 protein-L-isoaspartate(D-aspartate) O-methyltransferase [Nocardiopsis metallicus]